MTVYADDVVTAASPLFERVGGIGFARLPRAVQSFHRLSGPHALRGRVRIEAPKSPFARCIAWCTGMACRSADAPFLFELDAAPAAEAWRRHFPSRTMTSRLTARDERLVERLGIAEMTFAVQCADDALTMRLVRLRLFGIPWPRTLLPRVIARESGHDDRLHFDVEATLPMIGTIARYAGHLDLVAPTIA